MEEIKKQIKSLQDEIKILQKDTFTVEKIKIYGKDFIIINNHEAKVPRIEMNVAYISRDKINDLLLIINNNESFTSEYIYSIREYRGREDDVFINSIKYTNDYNITYSTGSENAGSNYYYTISRKCLHNVLTLIKAHLDE